MSRIYIHRMKTIGDEFNAARGVLTYASRIWRTKALYKESELQFVDERSIENAAKNLEITFIIRQFTTFEGFLKDHLVQHHSGITLPEDARAVWLIDRVALLQSPHIHSSIRQGVHEVRRYRNALVHADSITVPPLLLSEVRSRLNLYLDKLPDPFS